MYNTNRIQFTMTESRFSQFDHLRRAAVPLAVIAMLGLSACSQDGGEVDAARPTPVVSTTPTMESTPSSTPEDSATPLPTGTPSQTSPSTSASPESQDNEPVSGERVANMYDQLCQQLLNDLDTGDAKEAEQGDVIVIHKTTGPDDSAQVSGEFVLEDCELIRVQQFASAEDVEIPSGYNAPPDVPAVTIEHSWDANDQERYIITTYGTDAYPEFPNGEHEIRIYPDDSANDIDSDDATTLRTAFKFVAERVA